MFTKKKTTISTKNFSEQLRRLKTELSNADAVLIGAGAGLSTSAGFTYSGPRFYETFADFHEKYGITDMYSGGFYPYETLEEYWAWWSRNIYVNRYTAEVGRPYTDLLSIVKGKEYFVLTTNVDHRFQLAGFDKMRLFYTQGDYGLWQCSKPCHQATYDNELQIRMMMDQQEDMRIPTKLIPRCPICGAPMTMNLRCDDSFVQDAGWYAAANRYKTFLQKYQTSRILFLELGVGSNTPGIIKYPFWQMTAENPQSVYACINMGEAFCPQEIGDRSICIDGDIGEAMEKLRCLGKN